MTLLLAMLLAGGSIVIPASTNVWLNPAASPPATWCGGLCVGNADGTSTCIDKTGCDGGCSTCGACNGLGHSGGSIDRWTFDTDPADSGTQPSVSGAYDLTPTASDGGAGLLWRADAGRVAYAVGKPDTTYWSAAATATTLNPYATGYTVESWARFEPVGGQYTEDRDILVALVPDHTVYNTVDCYDVTVASLSVRTGSVSDILSAGIPNVYPGSGCSTQGASCQLPVGAIPRQCWAHLTAVVSPAATSGCVDGIARAAPCVTAFYLNGTKICGLPDSGSPYDITQSINNGANYDFGFKIQLGVPESSALGQDELDDTAFSASPLSGATIYDDYRRGRMCH